MQQRSSAAQHEDARKGQIHCTLYCWIPSIARPLPDACLCTCRGSARPTMVKVSSFGSEYELNSKTATSKATVKLTDGLKVGGGGWPGHICQPRRCCSPTCLPHCDRSNIMRRRSVDQSSREGWRVPALTSCRRHPPQATVAHRSASNAIALTLAGKQWEVQHDFHKKARSLKTSRGARAERTCHGLCHNRTPRPPESSRPALPPGTSAPTDSPTSSRRKRDAGSLWGPAPADALLLPAAAAPLTWLPWHRLAGAAPALQDTHLKYKAKLGKSTLTVKQHVPGGKWALAPNPGGCRCGCWQRIVSASARECNRLPSVLPLLCRPSAHPQHSRCRPPVPAVFELSRGGLLGKHSKAVGSYDFLK